MVATTTRLRLAFEARARSGQLDLGRSSSGCSRGATCSRTRVSKYTYTVARATYGIATA
jgi:hypothetical protein